ncbi:MAG: hypothetical protein ACFFD4_08235 [Candidatus Odinarchaeota archaeon]
MRITKKHYTRLTPENQTTITVVDSVATIVKSYMLRHGLHSMSHAIELKFADEKLEENTFGLWGRNQRQNYGEAEK